MDKIKHSSPFIVLREGETYQTFRQQVKEYEEALVNKWRWLLEGTAKSDSKLKQLPPVDERLFIALAMLFENQEATTNILTEDTLVPEVAMPLTYSLPLIRKVFPALIATRICSVQPMPLSSGGTAKAFFQTFTREGTGAQITTPDSSYALGTEQSVPKKIDMQITSVTVTAIKDILGAAWSSEIATDARYTLGIDVESEHLNALAEEILREIDQRILMEILNGASAGNANWSSSIGSGYLAKEWYETIGHSFVDADALLYAARFRDADYIVAGTTLYNYIRKMTDFSYTRQKGQQPALNLATQLVGTLNDSIDVYRSSVITATKGIVGFYPRNIVDAGYIYMPYEMLSPMPLVYASYDASTGAYQNKDSWTRNVRTRYGKYMAQADCFATLTVTG